MAKEVWDLEKLKKEYEIIRKKHNLLTFKEMNNDFEIEKLQERETEYLLKEVRRIVMDKAMAYLRFIEMLLNPNNCPLFFLSLLRKIGADEKKLLQNMYEKIGIFELEALELDCIYDEKREADFVKRLCKEWKSISNDMINFLSSLRKKQSQNLGKDEKGYLG